MLRHDAIARYNTIAIIQLLVLHTLVYITADSVSSSS